MASLRTADHPFNTVPELPPRDRQHEQGAARGPCRQPRRHDVAQGEVLAKRLLKDCILGLEWSTGLQSVEAHTREYPLMGNIQQRAGKRPTSHYEEGRLSCCMNIPHGPKEGHVTPQPRTLAVAGMRAASSHTEDSVFEWHLSHTHGKHKCSLMLFICTHTHTHMFLQDSPWYDQ